MLHLLKMHPSRWLVTTLQNDTRLLVGTIKDFYITDTMLLEDGWVQLDKGGVVSINGLDGYAVPELKERFPYARPKQ